MRVRTEKVVLARDGTRMYARETRGPNAHGVPMICANGIGVATFFWRHIEEDYSASRPVIVFDYPGHGESEWPRDLDDLTMEANADNLQRVLAAFGHERAIALGHSMGCQVIYTWAHRYPERAAMLVPMLGTYGRPVHTFLGLHEIFPLTGFLIGHTVGTSLPEFIGRGQRRLLAGRIGRRVVSRFARLSGLCHRTLMPQDMLETYLDHFANFSPLVFFRMAEHMASHDAGEWLEQIKAPTLVVAGKGDIFTPMALSREASERLPTARLLVLEEGTHAGLVEVPHLIRRELDDFMAEHQVDGSAASETPQAQVA